MPKPMVEHWERKGPGLWSRLVKAISPEQVRHPSAPMFIVSLPRTQIDYKGQVGDKTASSVVMAPVQWIQRAIAEARFRIVKDVADDGVEEVARHPLAELIHKPNEFYSGDTLLAAAVLSYLTDGNGYWHPARNGAGRPVELWVRPPGTMTPKWPIDGAEFLTHYEYKPGRVVQRLEVEDVVHFRHGLDPATRLGMSPLHSVLREIFSDMEASNFSASLLRNLGIPGLMISPSNEQQMTPEEVESTKKWVREEFGGDNRGRPLVMGAPTNVKEFGFSPDKMALSAVRNVSEERVCAALGIPAAVVGFGSGMEQTKVGATMTELRKLAWINGVLPILKVFAGEITRTLLTDEEQGRGLRADFDTSDVTALQDDEEALARRWNIPIAGGWARVAEGRRALDLDVTPADEVYLRGFSIIEVPAGQARPLALPDPEKGTKGHSAGRAGLAYVRALDTMERALSAAFSKRLVAFFESLGKDAAEAAGPLVALLEASEGEPGETKRAAGETNAVRSVLESLGLEKRSATFRQVYEAHYLTVAEEIAKAGEIVGLGVNLPDPAARAVVQAGGRRAGLVDLGKQTREALFNSLAEGRAQGLGADALARKIRETVGSGPWSTPTIRAKVIARTETKFAQNVSTVARAKEAGVEQFVVHDGRLGADRSTPEHIARDGSIVTAARAEEMAAEEHPNGTLSFSPFFEDDG